MAPLVSTFLQKSLVERVSSRALDRRWVWQNPLYSWIFIKMRVRGKTKQILLRFSCDYMMLISQARYVYSLFVEDWKIEHFVYRHLSKKWTLWWYTLTQMKMASSSALLKNIHRYQKRGTELRICGSQLLSAVLLKTSRTLRRNATTSNFCPKLSCAAFPIRSASPDTRASLLIAHAKLLKNVRRKL